MENETKATTKMTIARALKEKERVARKLRSARDAVARQQRHGGAEASRRREGGF